MAPQLGRVGEVAGQLSGWQLTGLVLVMVFVALLSHPLQWSLVRLFEGYWGGSSLAASLRALGIEVHRRRVERLSASSRASAVTASQRIRQQWAIGQLRLYPEAARLMPTIFGNVLRAAEDGAGERYGLSTVATLPRLYPQMSGAFAQGFTDLRNQLDVAVRVCATLMAMTAIGAVALLWHGWWLLVPAVTAGLSWLAYRAAVRTAVVYGQGLFVAFDLHRFDLLRALHYPLPDDPDKEREFNEALSAFLRDNIPLDDSLDTVHYNHDQEPDHQGTQA
jgi:hypothetical protein